MHELYRFVLGELRGAWRFRWWALAVAWVVAIAGAQYVLTMPDRYQVQTRLQVDTDSLLRPLLDDLAVSPDITSRVQALTTTLLNRENLRRIARESDLLVQASSELDEERILDGLARGISISNASSGRSSTNIYRIAYTSGSPQTARKVVQTSLDILMERSLGMSMSDSASATQFLERQVAEYEERLRAAEQRLARFKRENVGLLPEQGGGDYYQRLRATEEKLEALQSELRTAENRRDSLQNEIAAMEAGRGTSSAADPRVTMLSEQLQRSRERLDELLLRYTDQHPDVIALRAQIERQEEEYERAQDAPMIADPEDLSSNPVYQELQIRLNETNAAIAELQTQIQDEQTRLDRQMAQVDEITEVETRLADLNRNYSVTRERYQALLSRLNTAELSTEADAAGSQMSFNIIDPPTTPSSPDGPPRPLYLAALLPLGLGIGGALAYLLHQLRPVFQNRGTLAEWTGRPVLGSVSLVMTRTRRHMRLWAVAVFGLGVLSLAAAVGVTILYEDVAMEHIETLMRELPL